MKKNVFVYSISTIILTILAVVVFFAVRPILTTVTDDFARIKNHYITILRNSTGLDLSYRALSPSVLSGIRMSDIVITDVQSGQALISIDSIKLTWNIFKLFDKNPIDAFGELIISGITADYDYLKQYEVRDKLFTFIKSLESTTTSENVSLPIPEKTVSSNEETLVEIKDVLQTLFSFPLDIRIKDTLLSYADSNINAELFLTDISMNTQDQDETGHLNFDIDGRTTISSLSTDFFPFATFVARFSLQGNLANQLENSFAHLQFLSLRESDFTIPRFDIYSTYQDTALQVYLMQSQLPFSVSLFSDIDSNTLEVEFYAENLDPLEIISVKEENDLVKKLKGSTLSGAYNLLYNMETGAISYTADGSATISPKLIGDSLTTTFMLDGNSDAIFVDSLTIESDLITADYTGSIDLQNFLPQGFINLARVKLPSGNSLAAEIYIDSYENEMLLVLPQLYFGEKTLTALQLRAEITDSSIDFTFEGSDYSRAQDSSPGVFELSGSFLFDEQQFFQLQISAESMFLESAMEFALWCLPEENTALFEPVLPGFEPYIFSFDLFFSTDFKTLSYNIPYAIVANTKKDDEVLLFAANGNESVIDISSIDLLIGGQSIQAQISSDFGNGDDEIFFGLSVFFNSLPYTFSGIFMPNEYLNVTGDYNFNISVLFLKNDTLSGVAEIMSFPIAIDDYLLSLSTETILTYDSPEEWLIEFDRFEILEISGTLPVQPRVLFTGTVDNNGVFLNNAVYSDELSTVEGSIAILWTINDGIVEGITMEAQLDDNFSREKYVVNFEAYNPNRFALNDPQILYNIFFSADALIYEVPAGRFAHFQNEENTINATITALGTLENPSITLTVEDFSFSSGVSDTIFNGTVVLEDMLITATDVNVQYQTMSLGNIEGSLSLNDLSGAFDGFLEGRIATTGDFKNKIVSSPIKLSIIPLDDNADLPIIEKSFRVDVVFEELSSNFFNTIKNYPIEILRTPGRFDVTAGLSQELSGYFLDSGELSLSAKEGFFMLFDAFGIIENNEIAVFVDNIYADAIFFSNLVNLSQFSLHSGIVIGSGTITGDLVDPQINAEFLGTDIEISIPDYVEERLVCTDFRVTTTQNIFSAVDALFVAQESGAEVGLTVNLSLEQLLFSYLNLDIKTLNDTLVKGKYVMPNGTFTGDAGVALLVDLDNDSVEVSGTIDTENIEGIIALTTSGIPIEEELDVVVDLAISVGTGAQLFIPSKNNPLIRGLINQEEPLVIQMDTRYDTSLITGVFTMRGGEILYLNRSFFVRDARAVLNDSLDFFDPRLTATAEIRERDVDNDPVRIILSVVDQPLSQLNPTFTSVPSKPESEILTILGQIIIGDTTDTNPLALLGSIVDYGAQLTVFRNVENQLRDLINSDIFSLRTMVLQNAFAIAMNFNSDNNETSIGNFLDNTTVYIGKFWTDTLYADLMVHLTYDETLIDEVFNSFDGIVLQIETGLELPSPIGTIRWSIATPDIISGRPVDFSNLLVPYTSISLSWKFRL